MDNQNNESVSQNDNVISERDTLLTSRENAVAEQESKLSALAAELNAKSSVLQNQIIGMTEREEKLLANIDELEKSRQQLNMRINEVAQLELQAKNGFPSLFAERFSSEIDEIMARETAVAEQEKVLNEKLLELASLKLQAENGFQALHEERFAELIDQITVREKVVSERETALAKKAEEQRAIINEDISRAAEYISTKQRDAASKLHEDISAERDKLYMALDTEISRLRVQRLNQLQKEIDEQTRKIDSEKQELTEKEKSLKQLERELSSYEMRLDSRKNNLEDKEKHFEDLITERVAEIKIQHERRIAELETARGALIKQLEAKSQEVNALEQFKASLGGKDVAVINKESQEKDDLIQKLRKELEKRPPESLQEEFDRQKRAMESLSRENGQLKDKQVNANEASRSADLLRLENQDLKTDNVFLKDRNATIEAELSRLNTSKNPIDVAKRVEAIESPIITLTRDSSTTNRKEKSVNEMSEEEWLKNISDKCDAHGLVFPQRILWAYHTALKTAEMSPITVLAGVSGTGKSELPKLYSHFGGINFMPVSVQPNWDSQESMLGYFNSIDNRFDAQPLMRFLAQSAKETEKVGDSITGLRKYVNLVLLDEMNLAHVEYYFAEFLSKLEDRRSKGRNDEPQLEVKLGSDIASSYKLNLVRNVLWTGTMNQDETTKSLSDKVLDRGIVINFPRPVELKSRKDLPVLTTNNNEASKLLYLTWMGNKNKKGFVKRENYLETESNAQGMQLLADAKKLVEDINRCLSVAGRAVGHRVWQSIEYYILNYPSVVIEHENKSNLDLSFTTAFEDQIVQKIMPKLRGIETRGKQRTECLDKIAAILDDRGFNLTEDFRFACEYGYGQFMWNSAFYIDKSENLSAFESKSTETEGVAEGNEDNDNG